MANVSRNYTVAEIDLIPEPGRIMLITLGVIVTAIGIPGNILTAVPIVMCKSLRTRLNIFILNLCITDGIAVGYGYPFFIFDLILLRNPVSLLWCKLNHLVLMLLSLTNFITIMLITVSRYVKIIHEVKFDQIFSVRNTIAYCVLSWIPGCLVVAGTAIDLSQLRYFPDVGMCLAEVEDSVLTLSIAIPVFALAYVSSLVCYLRIWRRLRANDAKLRQHGNDHPARTKHDSNRKQASVSFLIVLMYICLTLPVLIVNSAGLPLSKLANATTMILYFGNGSFNCIVYGAMHKSIVKYYKDLLPTLKSNRVQPS